MVISSLLLAIWAAVTLRAAGTPVLPGRSARHLVTRGPFRYTRNPIYLGYILTLVGFGFLTTDAWFFIAAITAIAVTTCVTVRREEMYLLARFGMEFERYCRRTPRWL